MNTGHFLITEIKLLHKSNYYGFNFFTTIVFTSGLDKLYIDMDNPACFITVGSWKYGAQSAQVSVAALSYSNSLANNRHD